MKKSLCIKRSALSALSLAALLSSSSAFAASTTWLASPVTAKWNNAANWSALPQSGDSLFFGTSTQTSLTNDLTTSAFVINSLTVNSGGSAFTISGNAFTLGTSTSGTVITNNSSSDLTINDNMVLGDALQTIAANGAKVNLSGNISGAGANSGLALTASVLHSIVLSGANTYTGITSIGGYARLTLNFGTATTNVISSSSSLVLGDQASLYINGAASKANSQTFNGLTVNPGNNSINLAPGSGGTLTLNLGAITRNTGGTLNFNTIPATSGTVATTTNTNTNGILGTWASAGSGSPGSTGANLAISLHYATVNESGQIVAYTGGTQITGGASLITETAGTGNYDVVITSNTTINTSAVSVNTVRNASLASYTTTLGNTLTTNGLMNDATGSWTISGSTIKSGATKELTILASTSGQSVAINSVIADSDSGASALTYSGAGTLTLGGANTYSGSTYINGGSVGISAANGFGSSQNIYLNNTTLSTTGVFDLGSTRTLIFSGASGIGATYASGTLTVSGSVSTSGTLTTSGNGTILISGAISGDGGISKGNAGLLLLTGNNTYTGVTTVTTGTLQLGNGTSGHDGTLASGTIANAATLIFNRYSSSTYAGAITGAGTVTKNGAGTQTLSGTSSYTGATTVNAGKLSVNGSIASSAVTVNSGGTLGGSGTTGAVSVLSGGHLAPGNSISTTFTTGALTLAAGSVTDIELGSANAVATSSVNDRTTVNGALGLGGTLNLIDNAGANSQGSVGAGSYLIFTGATSVSGNYSGINNVTGYHAKVDSTSTAGSVYVNNYQIASANTQPATVSLGITHVGESFTNTALNVQNTGTHNGFSEGLNATKGTTTGVATLGGSDIGNLAGGAASTAITVGLSDTATVGAKTGTATVGFASNGTVSGYENTNLGSQTVTVNGQVNYYAAPTLSVVSGGDLTSTDATHFTLSLGSEKLNTGIYTATISLANFLQDATYQDLLSGAFDTSAKGLFTLSAGFDGTLEVIASGTNVTLTVSFDTTGVAKGDYEGTILFNPTSVNASGTSSLNPVSLGLEFTVVPEPSTWAMIVGGMGMLAFGQRLRRSGGCR